MRNRISYMSLAIVAALTLASLFPILVAYDYPPFLNDDSYITLTYAKNLAAGRGFVFNHPPATLGTTTPLFALVVAALASAFSPANIQPIAVFLTAFCWLGSAWTLYGFRRAWGLEDWQAGIVSAVIIGKGWIHFLGMEAYVFAFLLVLSLSLLFSQRFLLAGFAAGLLFLTRGEGILVCGVILITALVTQWRKGELFDIQSVQITLKIAIGFAMPVMAWLLYAQPTFGSVLPNTLAAKQAQGQNGLGIPFLQRLTYEWLPLWGKNFAVSDVPFINIWWLIIGIGLLGVIRNRRQWLIFIAWIGLYILGYTSLNVSAYWWYQLPILFVLQLLFGLGIIELVTWLSNRIKPSALARGISVILVGILLWVVAKPTVNVVATYEGDARGESYVALSQWFRRHTQPSDSIAFIEIGYLGYHTDNRIVDLAGLILPDIVPHIAKGDFAWGFWHYQPDYYVYLPDFDWALASIRADARFEQQYRPVATLPGPRDAQFVIYKRVDE